MKTKKLLDLESAILAVCGVHQQKLILPRLRAVAEEMESLQPTDPPGSMTEIIERSGDQSGFE